MKSEVRTFLIFTVTALTVVAVPLIVAFAVHLNGAVVAAIVAAVGAVVGALGTSTFWLFGRRQAAEADRMRAELEVQHAEHVKQALLLIEGQAELQLLGELAAIEQEARTLLGERPSSSIIRIRSRLQDRGVWSAEDVYDFDNALRTRNQVAHGDQEGLTKQSLTQAIETMERLRRKLAASQISPPSN